MEDIVEAKDFKFTCTCPTSVPAKFQSQFFTDAKTSSRWHLITQPGPVGYVAVFLACNGVTCQSALGFDFLQWQVNWLQVTGADITPAATHLSRGLGHVTKLHEVAAEHLIGYISTHKDTGLTFDRTKRAPERPLLVEHVDAEYGRNRRTGRADEGEVITVNGNLISWYTKAQTSVAGRQHVPRRDHRLL